MIVLAVKLFGANVGVAVVFAAVGSQQRDNPAAKLATAGE
jgi:hypothetical protein